MAPSFANECDDNKPEFYCCYIDDCFGATSYSRQGLEYFITSVNFIHMALKYTFRMFYTSISGNWLVTSIFYKVRLTQLFTALVIPPNMCQELHPILTVDVLSYKILST